MNVGKSTINKIVRQLKIRELEKKIKQIEMEKEILKNNRSFGLRLIQSSLLVDELKAYYPVSFLYNIFDIHHSSYKYWTKRPKMQSKEQVILSSEVKAAHRANGSSVGAITIAGIVTTKDKPLSHYKATRS